MIGIDTASISRVTSDIKSGGVLGFFTNSEKEYCEGKPRPFESYAGILCAKNAVKKALQKEQDIALSDIEIAHEPSGAPYVLLGGKAAVGISVSISHDGDMAVAVAVYEPTAQKNV